MRYFTYISYSWNSRNKLDDAIRKFLFTKNRTIIDEKEIHQFKTHIIDEIKKLEDMYKRCKPVKAHWWIPGINKTDFALGFDGGSSNICSFNIYKESK